MLNNQQYLYDNIYLNSFYPWFALIKVFSNFITELLYSEKPHFFVINALSFLKCVHFFRKCEYLLSKYEYLEKKYMLSFIKYELLKNECVLSFNEYEYLEKKC